MGCNCCGATGTKCCLCSQRGNKWFPWGEKRKVCWRCKEKQERLIEEREKKNARVRKLLAGVGE